MKPQRNSPERATMLIERRTRQELREYGFWPRPNAPFWVRTRPELVPAALNRWTGKPHAHTRAKSRRLKQLNGSRA